LVGLAITAVTLIGLFTIGPLAGAQSPEPAPGQPPAAAGEEPDGRPGWRGWRDGGGRHGGWEGHGGHGGPPDPEQVRAFRADLAAQLGSELGVSAEQVEAAFRTLVDRHLDEAVSAGRLDQAEADEALAAWDEGDLHRLFEAAHDHR
jgi:hypothetical protein